jgi:hypothetical protein
VGSRTVVVIALLGSTGVGPRGAVRLLGLARGVDDFQDLSGKFGPADHQIRQLRIGIVIAKRRPIEP